MIGRHVPKRVRWHSWEQGVTRSLDNRNAPQLLQRSKSCRAVVEASGKNDADGARTVRLSGRSEQWIDGRAEPVLLRTAAQSHNAGFNQEVAVRRRNIDVAGVEPHA